MERKPLPLFDISAKHLIAASGGGWEQIAPMVRDLRLRPREYLHIVVIGSRENLPSSFESAPSIPGLHVLQIGQFGAFLSYARTVAGRRLSGEFVVLPTQFPQIYLLMFVATRTYWRRALSLLIESLYPKVAPPFLTQLELYELLKQVRTKHEGDVRVLELTAKRRLRGESRKRFESIREWTDESVESAFREARQSNQWFRSVTFEIVRRDANGFQSISSQGIISKYGYFACNGDFDLYTEVVVNNLIRMGSSRLEFFRNRDRINTANHTPRPITIDYDGDFLSRVEDIRKLSQALRRFKYGSCTVLHSNPYFHVSVVDNKDYSTAEVWVLSPRRVLIVPQVRASEIALKRLVNHIFENFREGTISADEKTTRI
jgi:hypothetical protein